MLDSNTAIICNINPKDAGNKKQVATMNLKSMKKFNIKTGTWISITNPSLHTSPKCFVSVWPANIQEEIGVDAATLINSSSKVGDMINIKTVNPRIDFTEASYLLLKEELEEQCDSSLNIIPKELLILIINQQLVGCVLVQGNKIHISAYGKSFSFVVEKIKTPLKSEFSAFLISMQTQLHIFSNSLRNKEEEGGERERNTDTDINTDRDSLEMQKGINKEIPLIGGLKEEINNIKEIVELAISDRCKDYGIKAPRGILLHGISGTGKTLIAKSIAASLNNCKFYTINGPDFFSGFLGESEAKLRGFFEEASKNSPSIVFIDEIDGICPKREKGSDVENRIVATLLTIMDGIGSIEMNRMIVIGATNRIDSIDESLRRGGRFDREIEIGIPNSQARKEILLVYLNQIPNSLSKDYIEYLANITHGYVGADISNLCREAALCCLKRNIGIQSLLHSSQKKQIELSSLKVEIVDFEKALKEIRPNISTIRDVIIEVPKVKWSDIGGYEDVKQQIKESVELPLTHPEVFTKFNISPPKGILLYGPPGCSKTLMAKAIATESGLNFIAVKGPELYSKWVGQTEKALSSIFRKAKQAAPSILFFDEIDALVGSRGESGSVTDRVISQLLIEMNGLQTIGRVIVVAATNRPHVLDESLLTAGRFDRLIYISPPNLYAREEIFRISTSKMKIAKDVDISTLAKLTEGLTGAEVALVCREAAMAALEENINALQVTSHHFMKSIAATTPSISKETLNLYEKFSNSISTT